MVESDNNTILAQYICDIFESSGGKAWDGYGYGMKMAWNGWMGLDCSSIMVVVEAEGMKGG